MPKVLYWDNCWFTNVGEAFIDIGARRQIEQIWPMDIEFATVTSMSSYYVENVDNRSIKNRIKRRVGITVTNPYEKVNVARVDKYLNADYLIISGMFATQEFTFGKSVNVIKDIIKAGAKLIILGLGGINYDLHEIDCFKRFLDDVKPVMVTTRDKKTYYNYRDTAPCIASIDSAFWVVDSYDPRGFGGGYEVHTFNYTNEPYIEKTDKVLIRPWHMQYAFDGKNVKEGIFISDSPYDYLTIYANADMVYTDLIHASIPSLMYGTPVKYFYFDKRSAVFDSVEGLKIDKNEIMTISEECLTVQKQRIVREIRELLYRGGT